MEARARALAPIVSGEQSRTLAGLVGYFLKLGGSGFGGPIALVGYMQRDLVEQRRWFTEEEFRQGLAVGRLTEQQFVDAVAMGLISPGPVVIMATFAGYLVFGLAGAIVATSCRPCCSSSFRAR